MGFDVEIHADPASVAPAAVCDRPGCWALVGGEGVALFVANPDVLDDSPETPLLACSRGCAGAIMAARRRGGGEPPIEWGELPVAHYWVSVGLQLGVVPPELRGRLAALYGAL